MLLVDYVVPSVAVDETLINAFTILMILYVPVYVILRRILKNKYSWETFTRMVSLCNASQCIYIVFRYVLPNYTNYFDLNELGTPDLIRGLYWFAAYLLVDGIFYLPDFLTRPTVQMFTTVAHHFVGGFGMYLIAEARMGLGLGSYFAWTEISTPLLHMSWILYTNQIVNKWATSVFITFYLVFGLSRIATIPVLLSYINMNKDLIAQETTIHRWMAYLGSWTLIGLNSVWFIMLTIKAAKMLCPIERRVNFIWVNFFLG